MVKSRFVLWLVVAALAFGCAQRHRAASPAPADDDSGDAVAGASADAPGDPIVPTDGYRERRAAYLDYCAAADAPGSGGVNNPACSTYKATGEYDFGGWDGVLQELANREGSVDFHLQPILRVLYFDRRAPVLPDDLRATLHDAILGFKYWLDEPGPDDLQWWSENHQILYHAAELMAGQLFPDEVFPNSGMTGRDHAAHAASWVARWLDRKLRFGLSEWHSNVYFNETMPGLLNLVEFAEDPALATKAAMVLDQVAFDFAMNHYRGLYATTHGRTYDSHLLGGLTDSTREAAWLLLGLAPPATIDELSPDHFTACMLATGEKYVPPPILEAIANDALLSAEHKERDSVTVEEAPLYGIGTDSHEDVVFWWGQTGYVAPDIIDGSLQLIDDFDLWQGNTWRDLAFLKPLVGTPIPKAAAEAFAPMSRGILLEGASTYTYRTPNYQLSGAQDYKPGSWTGQVHVWQATLDRDAYVFTTYPGGSTNGYAAGSWTGGFVPRATLYRNVGVIQYRRPAIPVLDRVFFTDFSHAYFRRAAFDEVAEGNGWVVGRKGDGYVALWSQNPTAWSTDNDYELIASAKENVWIVELGDAASSGTFAQFVAAVQAASIAVGDGVVYESPGLGEVVVGWTGPMTVNGAAVDTGPYARWNNKYCQQDFGDTKTLIEFGRQRLRLDYEKPSRRYWDH